MNAVEIEDVLSSIRRLVSEELRPMSRPEPKERPGQRLVLTQAHRVDSAPPTPAPAIDPVEAFLAGLPGNAEPEPDDEGAVTRLESVIFQSRMAAASLTPTTGSDPMEFAADAGEAEVPAAPVPSPADLAMAEIVASLSAEPGPPAAPSLPPQAAPAAPAGIDEALLRDLVRDLIREELQGSLGERITRNVRKLVRAEIARAMSIRDLD